MTECPLCGTRLDLYCMKSNGAENGEFFENWVCDRCGIRFFVSWHDNNDNG